MRLLLDTHALLWVVLDSPRLSRTARDTFGLDSNEFLVSAVSAMEITLKHRNGKLPEAAPFIRNGALWLDDFYHTPLPITLAHASLAGSLDIAHKDPFDRLLIAQSRLEGAPLVSNETLFDNFGVERIW